MDAFYAAIEQRERPALRGRPVIVGGPRNARGVVSASSYEARAFGVHSAMPLRLAARLCPAAVFLPGRMDLYAEVSTRVLSIFRTYTPLVEPLSLDEAFLDVTGCERRHGPPRTIAEHLRRAVARGEGLVVSVGVAATKSVAKIASDVAKPNGCRVVPPGRENEFLAPMPLRALWGIGPKTGERLRARGIRTIRDLTEHEPERLRHGLGVTVAKSLRLARGVDPRRVAPQCGRKSVGNEVTFERDLDDRRLVTGYLLQLTDHVGRRLRAKRLRGRTVALKLRYADFRTISRQITLNPRSIPATRSSRSCAVYSCSWPNRETATGWSACTCRRSIAPGSSSSRYARRQRASGTAWMERWTPCAKSSATPPSRLARCSTVRRVWGRSATPGATRCWREISLLLPLSFGLCSVFEHAIRPAACRVSGMTMQGDERHAQIA